MANNICNNGVAIDCLTQEIKGGFRLTKNVRHLQAHPLRRGRGATRGPGPPVKLMTETAPERERTMPAKQIRCNQITVGKE